MKKANNIEIWLVRHGETDWNKQGRYCGVTDLPLNEIGIKQAELLAKRLKEENFKFSCILSSPLLRAKQTAEIIGKILGLEIHVVDLIKEIDYGDWEGLTVKQIKKRYSQLFKKWEKDPILYSPPNGETGKSVLNRVILFLNYLNGLVRLANKRILIISHNTFNRIFLCHVLGISPKYYRSSIIQDCTGLSIIRINFDEKKSTIVRLNDTSHLLNIEKLPQVKITCGVVAERNGKILIIREAEPQYKNKLNQPSGGIHKGETLLETGVRQVKEETGYDVKIEGLLGVYQRILKDGSSSIRFCMRGKIVGSKKKPGKEVKQILWVSPKEIKKYKKHFLHDVAYLCCKDFIDNKNYPLEILRIVKDDKH